MVIDMNETRLCALEQLKAFVEATGGIRFQPIGDDEGRAPEATMVLGPHLPETPRRSAT